MNSILLLLRLKFSSYYNILYIYQVKYYSETWCDSGLKKSCNWMFTVPGNKWKTCDTVSRRCIDGWTTWFIRFSSSSSSSRIDWLRTLTWSANICLYNSFPCSAMSIVHLWTSLQTNGPKSCWIWLKAVCNRRLLTTRQNQQKVIIFKCSWEAS